MSVGGKRLVTEVDIHADPRAVWNVLTDLASFHEWNPFIVEASGEITVAGRLELRMSPPGGRSMTFKPKVTEVAAARSLEWLGRLGVPGLFAGRHRFDLEPIDGGTRLIHSEEFTGILVPVFAKVLDERTKFGFEAMNAAMKERVEARELQVG